MAGVAAKRLKKGKAVRAIEAAAERSRQSTGIAGLDNIINGGLLTGSVYIIRGTPGAGKTIFANQICYHWGRHGKKCLYITLLSESHDRLIENLEGLSFYSADAGSQIHYQSGFQTFENDGLKGILRLVVEETSRCDSGLVILDGLFVLQERVDSEPQFRLFLNQLQNLAQVTGCTMLLLTNSDRGTGSPEYTMVDGWMELAVRQHDYRVSRHLQVHKLRGSGFVDGHHALTISDSGIRVFPRLERSGEAERLLPCGRGKLSTGIAELDTMIGGGLRQGSSTVLIGATGVGKTAFGLHFIAQSTEAEPGLIFGFYEDRDDLIEKAQVLGMADFKQALDCGPVEMIWHPSSENLLDELGDQLIAAVAERGVKRLLIDGINALRQSTLAPERIGRFLAALTNRLRNLGVTTVLTLETPELVGGETRIDFTSVSSLAQNIILLRYVELDARTHRTLAIVKTRTSGFDPSIRKFTINEFGISVSDAFQLTDDLLTGHAHPRKPKGAGVDD